MDKAREVVQAFDMSGSLFTPIALLGLLLTGCATTSTAPPKGPSSPKSPQPAATRVVWAWDSAGHVCLWRGTPGDLRCWGNNRSGELGDGTRLPRKTPSRVLGLAEGATVRALGLADKQSCAVLGDGAVYCWGKNYGDVGQGKKQRAPLSIPAVRAQPGNDITCALAATDGRVWCWESGDSAPARRAANLPPFVELFIHPTDGICGIQSNGEAMCWWQHQPKVDAIKALKVTRVSAVFGGIERPVMCYERQCWWADANGRVQSQVINNGAMDCGLHQGVLMCGQIPWDATDPPGVMHTERHGPYPLFRESLVAIGPGVCGVGPQKTTPIQCPKAHPTVLAWEPRTQQEQQRAAERIEIADLRKRANTDPAAAYDYLTRFKEGNKSFAVGNLYARLQRRAEADEYFSRAAPPKHLFDMGGWLLVLKRSLSNKDCATAAFAAPAAVQRGYFARDTMERLIDTCGSKIPAGTYAQIAARIVRSSKLDAVANGSAAALALNEAGRSAEALAAMSVYVNRRVVEDQYSIDLPLDLAEVYVRLGSDKDVRELVAVVRKSPFHEAQGTSEREAARMDLTSTLGRTIRMAGLAATYDKRVAKRLWKSAAQQVAKLPKSAVVAGQAFMALELAKVGKHRHARKLVAKARKRLPADAKKWPRWARPRLAHVAVLVGDEQEAMRLLKADGGHIGFSPVFKLLGGSKDGRAFLSAFNPQGLSLKWLAAEAANAGECDLAMKTFRTMGSPSLHADLVRRLTRKCPLMTKTYVDKEGYDDVTVQVLTYLGRFGEAVDVMGLSQYPNSFLMAELAVEWHRRGSVPNKRLNDALAKHLESFDQDR